MKRSSFSLLAKWFLLLTMLFMVEESAFAASTLVARWRLADGSGTSASDSSGNGITATVQGGSSWLTSASANNFRGGGMTFTGSNYLTTASNAISLGTGAFTLSAWVYPTSATTWMTIFGGGSRSSNTAVSLHLSSTLAVQFRVGPCCNTTSDIYLLSANNAAPLNQWTHVLAQRGTNGFLYLYINGVSAVSGAIANSYNLTDASNPLQIGAWNGAGSPFYMSGVMADARVYNAQLDQKQISQLAQVPGLEGGWSFNQASGTTSVSDISGSGNSITSLTSTSWVSGMVGQNAYSGAGGTLANSTLHQVGYDAFTISTWISIASTSTAYTIFSRSSANYTQTLSTTTGGLLQLQVAMTGYATNTTMQTKSGAISAGTWMHVAASRDEGGLLHIYVNGVDQSNYITYPQSSANLAYLWDETTGGGTVGASGVTISNFRIYNKVLTSEELTVLSATRGIVGLWSMNGSPGGTTTSAADTSGNGSNLSSSGAVSYTGVGALGQTGVFGFSSSAYLSTTNPLPSLLKVSYNPGFTIAFWFNTGATSPSVPQALLEQGAPEGSQPGFIFYLNASYNLVFSLIGPSYNNQNVSSNVTKTLQSTAVFSNPIWVHAAVVASENGTMTLYINGVSQASTSVVGGLPAVISTNPMLIGYDSSVGWAASTAGIEQVRMYNYGMSQTQISQLASMGGNLVAWWKFNDGSGSTIHDFMGNGFDLTLSGSGSWTTGVRGGAYNFNSTAYAALTGGYSQYAATTAFVPTAFGNHAFTIATWIKVSSFSGYQAVFSMGSHSGPNFISVQVTPTQTIEFRVQGSACCAGTSDVYILSTGTLTANTWAHVAVTRDASGLLHIYLNGALDTSGSIANSVTLADTTDPIQIGQLSGGTSQLLGTLDDMMIFNIGLDAAQIQQLGAVSAVPNQRTTSSGTVGWWGAAATYRFTECSGTTSSDATGHGNTATVSSWNTTGLYQEILPSTSFAGTKACAASAFTTPVTGMVQPGFGAFSMSFWLLSNSGAPATTIWSRGGSSNQSITVNADASITFQNGATSDLYSTLSTSSGAVFGANGGGWTHLIFLRDETGVLRIYVNGVLSASGGGANTSYIWDETNGIGTFSGGSYYSAEDLRFFNYALSASEIQALSAPPGLMLHYSFDDQASGSGSAADTSGNGFTATAGCGSVPTFTSTALRGYAMNFTGNSCMTVGSGSNGTLLSLLDREFSISFWVYPTSLNNSGFQTIFSLGTRNTGTEVVTTIMPTGNGSYTPANGLVVRVGSSTYATLTSSATLTASTWNHVVFSRGVDGVLRIYINATQAATKAGPSGYGGSNFYVPGTTSSQIGLNNNVGEYYNGNIDDFRVYNYALTPPQITHMYQNFANQTLHASWHFNDATSSSTASDGSGNGNTMSVSTGGWTTGYFSGGYNGTSYPAYWPLNNSMQAGGDSFSLAFWVNISGTATLLQSVDRLSTISQQISYSGGYFTFQNGPQNWGYMSGDIAAQNTAIVSGHQSITTGTWYHIVAMRDEAGILRLFLNGTQIAAAGDSNNASVGVNTTFVFIDPAYGATYSTNQPALWQGTFDEMHYYNYGLSNNEIFLLSQPRTLLARWKMTEGSGTTANDQINGYNATLNGSPTWASGIRGGALTFNGTTTQYGSVGNGTISGQMNYGGELMPLDRSFTMTAWVYPTSQSQWALISGYGNRTNNKAFSIFYQPSSSGNPNQIEFRAGACCGTTSDIYLNSGTTLPLNTWSHVAAGRGDDGLLRIWINGALAVTGTIVNNAYLNDPAPVTLGGTSLFTTNGFVGSIEDQRFYNYQLSTSELQVIALAPALQGYWKFGEGSSTTVTSSVTTSDSTASYLTGTIQSGSWNGTTGAMFPGTNLLYLYSPMNLTWPASSFQFQPGITAFSITGWFNFQSSTNYSQFINYGGSQAASVSMSSSGVLTFCVGNSGTTNHCQTATSSISGGWSYLTFMRKEDGSLRIYNGGNEITNTAAQSANIANINDTVNGNWVFQNQSFFSGMFVDELRFYTREMTSNELAYFSMQPQMTGIWRFEETAGSTNADTSGNGNTLTWAGSGNSMSSSGYRGYGITFNGSGRTTAASPAALKTRFTFGDYTVSFWFNIASLPSSNPYELLGLGSPGSATLSQFAVRVESTAPTTAYCNVAGVVGSLRIYYAGVPNNDPTRPLAAPKGICSPGAVPTAQWNNVTVIGSGGTVTAYLNGASLGSVTGVPIMEMDNPSGATVNPLSVGADAAGNNWTTGSIDELRIYNYAISNTQLQWLIQKTEVAHYTFDQSSGTSVTDTGTFGTNTGTIVKASGAASTTGFTWIPDGLVNGALSFDGDASNNAGVTLGTTYSNAYTSTNTTPSSTNILLSPEQVGFTWALWVYPTADTTSGCRSFMWYGQDSASMRASMSMCTNGGNKDTIEFRVGSSGTTPTIVTTATQVPTGKWTHIAGVRDDHGNLLLYVNGTQLTGGAITSGGTTNTNVIQGNLGFMFAQSIPYNQYYPLQGMLDDINMYNYPLSAAQIAALANQPQLVGWWKMDDGAGTTAADASGNGNTATYQVSGSTTAPTWVEGMFDGGSQMSSNATSAYFNAGNPSMFQFGTGAFSVAFWYLLPTTAALQSTEYLVSYGQPTSGTGGTGGWFVSLINAATAPQLEFGLANANISYNITSAANIVTTGRWYHVAATRSTAGVLTLYLNGTALSTTSGASGGGTGSNISVTSSSVTYPLGLGGGTGGSASSNQTFTSGLLDEVRLYNYQLTSAQVQQLAQPAGMALYYKMDEGSGSTLTDSSGNGNTGTSTGGPTYVTGHYNTALDFTAAGKYTNAPVSSTLNVASHSFTIATWVNVVNSTSGTQPLINYGISGNDAPFWSLFIDSSARVNFQIGDATTCSGCSGSIATASMYSGNGTIISSQWHHVAVVRSNIASTYTLSMYVDGQLVGVNGSGTPGALSVPIPYDVTLYPGTSQGFTLANAPGTTGTLNGILDDTRLYSRALSASEIAALANNGLAGHWPYSEGSGSTAADTSGSGNNATLTGAGWDQGNRGYAMLTSGSSQYASTTNDKALRAGVGEFTVSMWARTSNSSANQVIISNGLLPSTSATYSATSAVTGWYAQLNASGNLEFDLNSTAGLNSNTGSGPIGQRVVATKGMLANVWHFLTFQRDASGNLYIYRDGTLLQTATNSNANQLNLYNPLQPNGVVMGDIFTTSNTTASVPGFIGDMQDVRFYNRLLSANEINALYNGLVAYYKLDDGTGASAADSSGMGLTGTLNNMVNSQWDTAGKVGGALTFTGSGNQYISVTDNPILHFGTDAFTVSAWIRPTSVSSTQIISMYGINNAMQQNEWILGLSGGNLVFDTYGGNTGTQLATSSGTAVIPNVWQHVTAKRNYNGSLYLYVNGVAVASTAANPNPRNMQSSTGLTIGMDTGSGGQFKFSGDIDELKIWNYPLPDQTIHTLPYGIAGWWRLDETSGTSWSDSSGLGNTLGASGSISAANNVGQSYARINNSQDVVSSNGGVLKSSSIIPPALNPNTGAFTLMGWVYPTSTGLTSTRQVITFSQTPSAAIYLYSGTPKAVVNASSIAGGITASDVTVTVSGAGPLTSNVWSHLAMTRDSGGLIHLYVNGAPVATSVTVNGSNFVDSTGALANYLTLGGASSGSQVFDGYIDDMRYYNQALTDQGVSDVYNGYVGYYQLSSTTGTEAFDQSAEDNGVMVQNFNSWSNGGMKFSTNTYFNVGNQYFYNFGTYAFTAGFWYYPTTISGSNTILYSGSLSGSGNSWSVSNNSGILTFSTTDNTGTTSVSTPVAVLTTTTWTNIIVMRSDNGTLNISINGAAPTTSTQTTIRNVTDSVNGLVVGPPPGSGLTGANGVISGLQVYNRALINTELETLSDTAAYFKISESGYGISCAAFPVTVTAYNSSNQVMTSYQNTITIDTQTGEGTWTLATNGGSGTLNSGTNGVATYTFAPSDLGVVKLLLSYPSNGLSPFNLAVNQTNLTSVKDDGTAPAVNFYAYGLLMTNTPVTTPSTASQIIPTQKAGQAFNVYLTAYGQMSGGGDANCGIVTSYTGQKSLQFATTYNNPTTGTRVYTINGQSTTAPIQVIFTAGASPALSAIYDDAGSIAMTVTDTTAPPTGPVVGGVPAFVVQPAGFKVTKQMNASGTAVAIGSGTSASGYQPLAKAGGNFGLQIAAVDIAGNTLPNYGNETSPQSVIVLNAYNLVAPAGGRLGTTNAGTISNNNSFTKVGSGILGSNTLSFDEVGVINLALAVAPASGGANNSGSYLGTGNIYTNDTVNVGRFTPDHYNAVTTTTGALAASCGTYTYLDQAFTYSSNPVITATAYNASNVVTQNYIGSFYMLPTASSGALNETYADAAGSGLVFNSAGAGTSGFVSGSNVSGTGQYTFKTISGSGFSYARPTNGTNVGPFNGQMTITYGLLDSDGITGQSGTYTVPNISFPTNTGLGGNMVHGRGYLQPAIGPDHVPLNMNFLTQYYNGNHFEPIVDSCSVLPAIGNVTMNPSNFPTSASYVPLTANSFVNGAAVIQLSAPSFYTATASVPPTQQYVTVTVNLTSVPYLQWNWPYGTGVAGHDDKNPSAQASFGYYSGPSDLIELREQY